MGKYSGDIALSKAWDILTNSPNSFLIDVRTIEECIFVGAPWLKEIGKETVHMPWRLFPNMEINPHFITGITKIVPDINSELLFICRSGARSGEAAQNLAEHGYKYCYNITEGFEGNLNNKYQRGNLSGWKAANLPWRQN
ncbi:rhodanese-like domain-containing protein [Candidatus Jidaibacter acanthamoebae]|nr:rhodanese-like domain-containing protein [Candidatus Jidaibacter acanthamoeba]